MNRESTSYFSELPEVHTPRSKIIKEHGLKTTWNVGDIVPCYLDFVDPGTTIEMKMASVMRMQTPLYPTMDPLFTDIMFFAIPVRLLWKHWVNFWGENPNAWYPEIEYTVPMIKTKADPNGTTFPAKSLADYFGFPTGVKNIKVSALPFRAYSKVYNDWFRSTPLQQEAPNTDGDDDEYFDADYAYKGGALLKANKLHDVFTSALPTPMRGPEVTLPLGTWAPVKTRETLIGDYTPTAMSIRPIEGSFTNQAFNLKGITEQSGSATIHEGASISNYTEKAVYPNNLWADLSNATAATLGALRSAIAVAHFFEASARYGSRYIEILKGIFNVTSPDARLQRSEYLGGVRIPHVMQTVVQTSSTDDTSPQGNTGAMSHTVSKDEIFTKSFVEHTVILGVLVTRYKHSYSQGIPAIWSKRKLFDFYNPFMNGISEVPVYNREIMAQGTDDDDEVFGYQEYGYEMRYGCGDIVTGEMRPNYEQTLDAWHYGDYYETLPTLGASWIQEDKANVDRTLVVSSGLADQLFGDFYFKPTYVLPMPIYSLPGMDKI